MKKLLKNIVLCFFLFATCSCENYEEPVEDDLIRFQTIYNEKYPNGYSWGENWYEYEAKSIYLDNEGNLKTEKIYFAGRINMETDKSWGYTNEFICESETIESLDDGTTKVINTFDSLSESVWYSYEKISNINTHENSEIFKGRKDIESMNVSFELGKELFDFTHYFCNTEDKLACTYNVDNFVFENNNYVRGEIFKAGSPDAKWYNIVEYYFDDNFKIKEIKETISGYTKGDYTTVATFKIIDEINVDKNDNFTIIATEKNPSVFEKFGWGK